MNPLELKGQDFLVLYFVLLAIAAPAAMVLRWLLRGPHDVPPRLPSLDPYELAYVAGGGRGVLHAALASLVHKRILGVDRVGRRVKQAASANNLHWAEQKIYDVLNGEPISFRSLCAMLKGSFEQAGKNPLLCEMVVSQAQSQFIRIVASAPLMLVLLLGVAKIGVGISRDRPVSFLVMLSIVTLIGVVLSLRYPIHATVRGSKIINNVIGSKSTFKTTASRPSDVMMTEHVAIAAAMFGLGMFSTGELGALSYIATQERQRTWASSTHSCGSSCGSSCGGSSCSSCGGSGCGGCSSS